MEDGAGDISAGAHDNRRDVEGHVTRTGDNAKVRLRSSGAGRRKQLHLTEVADLGRIRGKRSTNGLAHVTEDKVGDQAAGGGSDGSDDGSLEASQGGKGHGARSDELIGIQGAGAVNAAGVVVSGLGGDLTNETSNG